MNRPQRGYRSPFLSFNVKNCGCFMKPYFSSHCIKTMMPREKGLLRLFPAEENYLNTCISTRMLNTASSVRAQFPWEPWPRGSETDTPIAGNWAVIKQHLFILLLVTNILLITSVWSQAYQLVILFMTHTINLVKVQDFFTLLFTKQYIQ